MPQPASKPWNWPSLLLLAVIPSVAGAQTGPAGRFEEQALRMPAGLGAAGPSTAVDLNGDGLLDVLRASGPRLDVLLQQPDGSFVRRTDDTLSFSGALTVSVLAAADLNGDTHADLVVGLDGAQDVVLFGDGSGALSAPVISPIPSPGPFPSTPSKILTGEFDGLPGVDVCILSEIGVTQLLVGGGGGGPTSVLVSEAATRLPLATRLDQRTGVAIDLDGDLDDDLVLSSVSQGVTRVLENVAGTFLVRHVEPFAAGFILPGDFDPGVTGAGGTDLLLVRAAGQTAAQPRLLRATSAFAYSAQPLAGIGPLVVRDAQVGDFDADPSTDFVVILPAGEVVVMRNADAATIDVVLGPDSHVGLVVADLEGDNDDDVVVVGLRPPDQILLGNGAGRFLATERPPLVSSAVVGHQLALSVGRERSTDPDLIVYGTSGASTYFDNDAGAGFQVHSSATAPSFPLATFEFAARLTAPAAPSGEGAHALLDPSGPGGVRILLRRLDETVIDATSVLWPAAVAGEWMVGMASGRFGGAVAPGLIRDLVFVDVLGQLRLFRATAPSGAFEEVAAAFPPVVPLAGVRRILVGRINGDGLADVCVLHGAGASVFLGQPLVADGVQSFAETVLPTAAGLFGSMTDGALADLDDDGVLDLVALTPTSVGSPVTALVGDGAGAFQFGTPNTILTPESEALAADRVLVVGSGERQALVFGFADGSLRVAPKRSAGSGGVGTSGTAFESSRVLPLHGTGDLEDLLLADVDVDGDQDLFVLRDGAAPQVLFNRDLHLSMRAVAQAGRTFTVRLDGDPSDVVALFLGFVEARFVVEPFGPLRLADAVTLTTLPIGQNGVFELTLPLDPAMADFDLNLQLAALRFPPGGAPTAVLGNLRRLAIRRF